MLKTVYDPSEIVGLNWKELGDAGREEVEKMLDDRWEYVRAKILNKLYPDDDNPEFRRSVVDCWDIREALRGEAA